MSWERSRKLKSTNHAARNGENRCYGTSFGSNAAGASWNVYFAQTTDNGTAFSQSVVNPTSNHMGVICTEGTACAPGTRNLLDFFEVGIDPNSGLAAIVYVDDALPRMLRAIRCLRRYWPCQSSFSLPSLGPSLRCCTSRLTLPIRTGDLTSGFEGFPSIRIPIGSTVTVILSPPFFSAVWRARFRGKRNRPGLNS